MTEIIDDSALCHGGNYDPDKAHQYYLRTRKLKGRRKGSNDQTTMDRKEFKRHATGNEGTYDRPNTGKKSGAARRAEIAAQKAALEKRLDRLRDVLAELVEQAKSRSGVEKKESQKDSAAKKDTPKERAKKSSDTKADPLTEKQKRDKATKAREEYEKQNGGGGPTAAQQIERLQGQIKDIRAMIKKAAEDAQEQSSQSKPKTAANGR